MTHAPRPLGAVTVENWRCVVLEWVPSITAGEAAPGTLGGDYIRAPMPAVKGLAAGHRTAFDAAHLPFGCTPLSSLGARHSSSVSSCSFGPRASRPLMIMSGRDTRGPEEHDRATGVARPQLRSDSIEPNRL